MAFGMSMRKIGVRNHQLLLLPLSLVKFKSFCSHNAIVKTEIQQLINRKPNLTCYQFNNEMNEFIKGNKYEYVVEMFNNAYKYRFYPNEETMRCLMESAVKYDNISVGFIVVSCCVKRGFMSFGTVLAPLLNRLIVKGDDRFAFDFVISFELEANTLLANVFIQSLCNTKKLDRALGLYKFVKNGDFLLDSKTGTILVKHLLEEDRLGEAMEIYYEVTCSVSIYNEFVSYASKNDQMPFAEGIVGDMIKKGVVPNLGTYNNLLVGYNRIQDIEDAKILFDVIPHGSDGVIRDEFTYNSLFEGYCKSGLMDDAFVFLKNEFPRGKVIPSQFTFSVLLKGLFKTGRGHQTKDLYPQMKALLITGGRKEDERLFCTLLQGLIKCLRVDEAQLLFDSVTDEEHKRKVAQGLCRLGYWLESGIPWRPGK